ncbi:MAG: hypothetical protein FJX77_10370 [Armatimonadetes bacterium]|nr:hypothetical protein [Armatimonadota bacterium]
MKWGWLLGAVGLLLTAAAAQDTETGPQARRETAALQFEDFRRQQVRMRIPLSLNRPANAFRLYGMRPLTLKDPGRRRDLYRDAFLEVATGSLLQPRIDLWAPLDRQIAWLGQFAWLAGPGTPSPPSLHPLWQKLRSPGSLARGGTAWVQELARTPLPAHAATLMRALGKEPPGAAGPVVEALAFRALATDEAEQRLRLLGSTLGLEGGTAVGLAADPALRDGYRAARNEFDQVRQGLWPGIAAAMRKRQGELVLDAVKPLLLSGLGAWAILGYLGWQAAESAVNVEYQGQSALCLATLAVALAEADHGTPEVGGAILRTEFALNHQLTQALKREQPLAFKPAGGRREATWQIRWSERNTAIRQALLAVQAAPGAPPGGGGTPPAAAGAPTRAAAPPAPAEPLP